MVHTYKRMPGACKYKDYTGDQLDKAIEAVRNGTSLRKAAEEFGVSRCSINRAINVKNRGKVGRPSVFSDEEQQTLAQCLCMAGDWGFPLTVYDIRLIVKAFLDRSGKSEKRFKDNMPGVDFVMSFIQRYKKILSNKMCQNIKRSRATEVLKRLPSNTNQTNNESSDCSSNWVSTFENYLEERRQKQ